MPTARGWTGLLLSGQQHWHPAKADSNQRIAVAALRVMSAPCAAWLLAVVRTRKSLQ
jgi:hypothetical protein